MLPFCTSWRFAFRLQMCGCIGKNKFRRSERVELYTPRTLPTLSLDFARAPSVEQRWERRHVGESVHNAGASAATVGRVEHSYMHGALLAKGVTAAIEHSEHLKTLLIDYIPHKPTDDPYAHPYP
jgi:uncharacterized protein YerC